MARPLDYGKSSERSRIARSGSECITDDGVPGEKNRPRKGKSKAAIQAEIDAAKALITRTISCACGHAGTIMIPQAKRHARLLCSRCGKVNS